MAAVNVIVVGGGPSGLVTAKEALAAGLVPLVLEREAGLGGVWRPGSGCAWDTMTTNLSKHTCAFSDFAWPQKDADVLFPRKATVHAYLQAYAAHFGLGEVLHFGCRVEGVERSGDAWRVRWRDADGKEHEMTVPHVVIASGVFSAPNVPEFEAASQSTAKVIHSSEYADGGVVAGKRVLVVGSSLTALELAAEIADSAASVTHAFRSPTWVLPRVLPADLKPPETDDEREACEMLPIDLAFYTRSFYARPVAPRAQAIVGRNAFMATLCSAQQAIASIAVPKEAFDQPINTAVSDRYVDAVAREAIAAKRKTITRFRAGEDAVEFSDGTVESYDVVILCTGYRMDVHYLDATSRDILAYDAADTLQPLVLYRATVHPRLPGLFFVGMYKGPYFAVLELQAKWATRVFCGSTPLPDTATMEAEMKEVDLAIRTTFPRTQFCGSTPLPDTATMEAEMKEVDLAIRTTFPRTQFPHPDYVRMADGIATIAGLLNLEELKSQDADLYERYIATQVVCDGGFSLEEIPEYFKRVGSAVAAAKASIKGGKHLEPLEPSGSRL